jgi:hypothetical protein
MFNALLFCNDNNPTTTFVVILTNFVFFLRRRCERTGNNAWYLKDGFNFSETHTSAVSPRDAKAVINHPIDVYYETSSSEGWPRIVCEVWDRSEDGMRGFVGCGSAWLPSTPGENVLTIQIWKPISSGLDSLSDMWLPYMPDLVTLRELTCSPYLRSEIQTESVGSCNLKMATAVSGFEKVGVALS